MDELMRPHEPGMDAAPARTVSRRAFFNRARLAVLAVAGAAVFGVAISTTGATASEKDEEKEKGKKNSGPRDKDRETKEKEQEQESSGKSSEKKKSSSSSNTKKKSKNTNGDDGKKKHKQKKNDPIASSPYGKYVVDGKDQYGCSNFASQAEAQAVLRLAPKDPNNLDSNRNGIACDGSEAFMDGVTAGLMPQPFDLTAVPRT